MRAHFKSSLNVGVRAYLKTMISRQEDYHKQLDGPRLQEGI